MRHPAASAVLTLQRQAGNAACSALLAAVQRQTDGAQAVPGPPGDLVCPAQADPGSPSGTEVRFGRGSSALSSTARAALGALALGWSGQPVRIDAYASTEGPLRLNWHLSCDRARSVELALTQPPEMDSTGIPEDSISIVAHGPTSVFDPGSLEPNRSAWVNVAAPAPPPQPQPEPQPQPQPSGPEDCAQHLGTCEYYRCRERRHPLGPTGYYLGYGGKYCDRFSTVTRPTMTTAGQGWIDCTLSALQQFLENSVPYDADADTVKRQAYDSHPGAYVGCGVCSLPPGDMTRLENTVDSEDMEISQVLSVAASCLTLPKPPATEGFQTECVMRLGGCPQTVSGGIPTPDDIARYNQQCRSDLGYTGPDVTPSSEDCARYFGGGS